MIEMAVCLGLALGFGVWLVLLGLNRPVPHLVAAIDQLRNPAPINLTPPSGVEQIAKRFVKSLPGTVSAEELRLVGRTTEWYAVRKLVFTVGGALYLPLLIAVLILLGVPVPIYVPAGVAVMGGLVGFFLVDSDVKDKAKFARLDMRRALSSYLDLVALGRRGRGGAISPLIAAANIGNGWAFQRIRDALRQAELTQLAPWDALARLANDTGIEELADLASITRSAGTSGADIADSLKARAVMLRANLQASAETEARSAAQRVWLPVSGLLLTFLLLLIYPFAISIIP